jgi:hypothetical protein
LGKILVIGASGLIGKDVVKTLGEGECIRASRSSDERVDISDPKSLAGCSNVLASWTESSAPAGRRA